MVMPTVRRQTTKSFVRTLVKKWRGDFGRLSLNKCRTLLINPMNIELKNSQFNVFFDHEDKTVGYNGFTNEFLELNPELYSIYETISKSNDWNGLEEVHEDFFNALVNLGFLVPKDTNEVEKVKKVVYEMDQNDRRSYQLTINPTMNCNFKCWYCYETHIKDSKMSSQTLEKIVNHVKQTVDSNDELQHFSLSWFGGEPLLYFHKTVVPILKEITPIFEERNIVFTSGFTSNGFLIDQSVIDACKKYNATFFQITLDGHRERHNQVRYVSKERGSYDEIVSNIRLCLQNEVRVSVRINCSEETLENVLLITEDFKDLTDTEKDYLNFSFHEVWQEEKDITRDIANVVEHFRSLGLVTLYNGVNIDHIRQSCYADKKYQATINYNGDVYKCTARDFETPSREGVLLDDGTIDWNEKHSNRMEAKFKNEPCQTCKLLPICGGGCSQQALEHSGRDYCLYNYDEDKKTDIIRDKYLFYIS